MERTVVSPCDGGQGCVGSPKGQDHREHDNRQPAVDLHCE